MRKLNKDKINVVYANNIIMLRNKYSSNEKEAVLKLSKKFEVHPATWYRWEKGTVPISATLHRIANYFCIDAKDLLYTDLTEDKSTTVDNVAGYIVNDAKMLNSTPCNADVICQQICNICQKLPPDDRDDVKTLLDILRSGDTVTVSAIKSNLQAFKVSVDRRDGGVSPPENIQRPSKRSGVGKG